MSEDDYYDRPVFLGFGFASMTQHVFATKKEKRAIKRRQKFIGFVDLAKLSKKLKRKRKKLARKEKRRGRK